MESPLSKYILTPINIVYFNIVYNEKHRRNAEIYEKTFPDPYSIARVAKITWPIIE